MQFIAFNLFRMREGMTYLSPAPIYHSAPQASVACALRLGSTSVIMERFDPEQFLALVEQHRITHSQVVPTMFSRMLKLPADVRERYDVSSLEVVIHAAAPCPVPVKQAMIDWFGPILVEYYGATEANGFTWCDSEQWLAHPGHGRGADPRHAADPRRRRQRGADRRDRHGVVRGGDELHLLPRRGEDGGEPRRDGAALDGRRRRLRRRRRLPLPHRPQDVHDHLRRGEHLPAGGGEPARHPRQGARRGGHRCPQRGPRRGGQGRRPADAWRRARSGDGARAARPSARSTSPASRCPARSTSRTSCRACRPASCTSACCATATGATARRASSDAVAGMWSQLSDDDRRDLAAIGRSRRYPAGGCCSPRASAATTSC